MIRITTGPFAGRRFASERAYRKAVARRRGVTQVRRVPLPKGTVIIGHRRPTVTRSPFDPQIPSALHYYLIEVTILPTLQTVWVYLVQHRGQRPLTDAQIQRQLENWWRSTEPEDERYEDELGPWKILAIYR